MAPYLALEVGKEEDVVSISLSMYSVNNKVFWMPQ